MNAERFQALVDELTVRERANPRSYLRGTLLMVLVGYAYIAAVLILAVLALLVAIAVIFASVGLGIMLSLALVAFVGMTLRALWTRFDEPDGRRIAEGDLPRLRELAEQARVAARAPRWHVTVVSDRLNAAVAQIPRLGMLGWHRNVLEVGVPVLLGTTRDEAAAILAHEMGHLSRAHGRVGAWIGRQQQTWHRIATNIREQGRGAYAFGPFIRWFLPRLNARCLVLNRAQEREADHLSVAIAGSRVAADALVRVRVAERLFETVVDRIFRLRETQAHPPAEGPFAAFARASRQPLPPEAESWLAQALSRVTTAADTHPCLRDRLEALGEEPRLPAPIVRSAGEELLGPEIDRLVREMDDEWRASVAESWKEQHEGARAARLRLGEIERLRVEKTATADQLSQRARLLEALDGPQAALVAWLEMRETHAGDPRSAYHAGRLLLESGDATGVALVEESMSVGGRGYRVEGSDLLFQWHDRRGERDSALAQARIAEGLSEEQALAGNERDGGFGRAVFHPHGLGFDEVEDATQRLSQVHRLRRAWLVRREVKHCPDIPAFVLVVEHRRRWWYFSRSETPKRVATEAAEMPVPGTLHVLCEGLRDFGAARRLAKKVGPPFFECRRGE